MSWQNPKAFQSLEAFQSKEDDVHQNVGHTALNKEGKMPRSKAPKI